MKLTEVCCLMFGHKWHFSAIFRRYCRRCFIHQVAELHDKEQYMVWRTMWNADTLGLNATCNVKRTNSPSGWEIISPTFITAHLGATATTPRLVSFWSNVSLTTEPTTNSLKISALTKSAVKFLKRNGGQNHLPNHRQQEKTRQLRLPSVFF